MFGLSKKERDQEENESKELQKTLTQMTDIALAFHALSLVCAVTQCVPIEVAVELNERAKSNNRGNPVPEI